MGDNGGAAENGGGIRNQSVLTLLRVTVSESAAGGGGNGGDGGHGGNGSGAQDGGDSVGGAGAGGGRGGGLFNDHGTVTITDSVFSADEAGRGGLGGNGGAGGTGGDNAHGGGASTGGMAGDGGSGGAIGSEGGTLTITRTSFTRNSAGDSGSGGNGGSGGAGGAGGSTPGGSSTGGQGFFGGFGGGIDETNTTLQITDSVMDSNHAGSGGVGGSGGIGGAAGTSGGLAGHSDGGNGGIGGSGGSLSAFNNAGTVTITRSLVFDSDAGDGGNGGAGGSTSTTGVAASQATTGGPGGPAGAVGGVDLAGPAAVVNSTIAENVGGTGGDGGAGGNGVTTSTGGQGGNGGGPGGIRSNDDTLALTHDTIADNAAGLGGSGGAAGAGNTATGGGGGNDGLVANVQEALSGDIVMRNTILQANSATPTCGGTITDGGHNLSFPATDLSCDAEVRADPLLEHIDDNGGPTPTLLPASNSPALDAVPASGAFCASEDARDVPRPRGGACDIGAVERTAPTATTGAASGTTVAGKVNPDGLAGSARFEFGKTTAYGSATPDTGVAGGVADVDVGADLGALEADTTYHYRVVIVTPDGTVQGEDATFKTPPAPVVTPPPPPPGGGNPTPNPFAGVTFVSKRATVDKKGRTAITLRCPAGTSGSCTGKLTLSAKIARKRQAVGSKRFTILAGKTLKVKIKLSAKARRALKKPLKITAAAAAKDANGTSKTTKATITLKRKR